MSTRPRRILYVHHRPELGGAPSSLSQLLRVLDRSRYEPHVYCPEGPVTKLFEAAGAVVHEGPVAAFTHIWASTYRGRRWMLLGHELRKLPRHVHAFERILDETPFDLVHLNDSPLVVAAWMAHRRRLPVVWHLRSALPETGGRRSAVLRTAVSRLGTTSIAITRDVATSFQVPAEIIPNSVDLDAFRPGDAGEARTVLELDREGPIVTFVGFLYPSKGFREFITAANLLERRGIRATYLMVGGPVRGAEFFETRLGRAAELLGLARDHEREAAALAVSLGLGDRLRFVAFTPDTPRVYQASDVIVAPSRGPELGRPLIEAAACGRPVVASGSLDGAEIVLPGVTGMLIPRRSPDALAATLAQLLEDPERRRRIGAAARRHAEESFDQHRNAERVTALYERILSS